MHCTSCGQEYESTAKFCPNCGAARPTSSQPADTAQPAQAAYIRQDYNPAGGQYSSPPPVQPTYNQAAYQTPYQPTPGYDPNMGQPKPSATGMIIMSIINIVCCGWGISTILGIIALIFSIMASSETNYAEAANKLKTAKILNIIGIVLAAIFVLVYVFVIIAAIAAGGFNGLDYFYEYSY